MNLYYKKGMGFGRTNFGDILNAWLWPKIIPELLDNDPDVIFVGIGSLINQNLMRNTSRIKVVFSTGVGYYDNSIPLAPDDTWRIYCLRGPLSAQALGVPEELAIADGGILVGKYIEPSAKKLKFSFMPHCETIFQDQDNGSYKELCEASGMGFIDPAWEVDKVLSLISASEFLITEALHGAIAADALRVPWLPVIAGPQVLRFKWEDWCASIGAEYSPVFLQRLLKPSPEGGGLSLPRAVYFNLKKHIFKSQLSGLRKKGVFFLSKKGKIEELTSRLEEKIGLLKRDFL